MTALLDFSQLLSNQDWLRSRRKGCSQHQQGSGHLSALGSHCPAASSLPLLDLHCCHKANPACQEATPTTATTSLWKQLWVWLLLARCSHTRACAYMLQRASSGGLKVLLTLNKSLFTSLTGTIACTPHPACAPRAGTVTLACRVSCLHTSHDDTYKHRHPPCN